MGRRGRPPLDPARRAEIARLLAAGELSERQIARVVGVARTTVRNVRVGAVPPTCVAALAPGERRAAAGERCPTCGAPLAVAPCRACRTWAWQAERARQIAALFEASDAARRARVREFVARHGARWGG